MTNIANTPVADQSNASLYTGTLFDLGGVTTTYVLTANPDTFGNANLASKQVFNAAPGTFTVFDNLTGGTNTGDVLNISDATVAGFANPAVVTVTNIENVNFNLSTAGTVNTAAGSGFTGVNVITVNSVTTLGGNDLSVTADATTAVSVTAVPVDNNTTINGGSSVQVTASGVTTGAVTVTEASGAVSVTSNVVAGGGAGAITIDTTGASVSVTQNLGAGLTNTMGAVDVTNGGSLATVSAVANKGAGATITYNTVDVTGLGSATVADTITSITATGYTTLTTAHTNSLSSLSLGTGSGNITIDNGDAGASTTTLALAVNGLTGGTLDDDDIYTTINVTSTGAASTLANITDTALTTLTLAGDQKLTLTSIAGATALALIDSSAATGGMTISSTLLTSTQYTGGDGVDTITLGAITQAIATGAGNDVVTLAAGTTALGTGGTIDAGAGAANVLSFADADDATTASGGTTFETKISNFQVVRLAGAAGAGVTVNAANLDDIAQVDVAVDLGQTLAVSNIVTGGKVSYATAQTAATTVTVTNAAAGSADTFNISISAAAARNINTVTVSNVETINFLTDDTAATTTGIEHTASLTAAAAQTITVAGDAGLTLTFTGTALTTFDASGVTDGDVTWTAGALASSAAVSGGATSDANVIVLSAALASITYVGGTGTDTITMNHATNHDATVNSFTLGNGTNTLTAGNNDGDNSVVGGTGVDTITVGNGDNVISTSSGNDVVTVGTGANTIDVGSGNDTVTIGASVAAGTIDVGAGTDAIVFTGVQTSAGAYYQVTGMGAGDTFDFSATANDGGGLPAGALGAGITLGAAATWTDYLNAAAAGDGSTDSIINWFNFGGNTFIVLDNGNGLNFTQGVDQVVALTGVVNLATSTQDGSYVITLV